MNYNYRTAGLSDPGAEAIRRFFAGVYAWMTAGLLVTTGTAAVVMANDGFGFFFQPNVVLILCGLELALVFGLSFTAKKMEAFTAGLVFLVYALLNGFTLPSLLVIYELPSVVTALAITCGMYVAMAVYGFVTKRSLDFLGTFLLMGLFGLLIALVVEMFVQAPFLTFAINCSGVLIFSLLTAYDHQKLKEIATDNSYSTNAAVMGALTLYLDFINLFIYMLRVFGQRK
jgi:uncharacterized protein